MKIHLNDVYIKTKGFTLVEISLVIGLLLGLATFAGMNMYAVRKWQKGKDAAVSLQGVLAAQKAYLSDHPTASMASVNVAQLSPYLPQGWTGMPAIEGLDDELLTIDHTYSTGNNPIKKNMNLFFVFCLLSTGFLLK